MRKEVLARLFVLALAGLGASGCAARANALAAEVPRAAMPVAIDEVLKAGEDARTRERMERILATPEMQRAIGEIAKSVTTGVLEEMSSDESKERIKAFTSELTRGLAEAMRTELSTADRLEIERTVSAFAASGARGVLRTTADELPTTVGPAVNHALVRELRDPELRGAVSGLVTETTRDAVLGVQEAISGAREKNKATGKTGPLGFIRNAITLSWGLAFGLGVVVVAVLAWGLRMKRRTKRYRLALVNALAKNDDLARVPEDERRRRLVELLQ